MVKENFLMHSRKPVKPKSLFIVFDHSLAYRSYTQTGIIENLSKIYETSVFILGVKNSFKSQSLKVGHYNIEYNSFESFLLAFYANVYWNRKSSNSLSMQNRSWYKKREIRAIFSAEQIAFYYAKIFMTVPLSAVSFFLNRVIKQLINQLKPNSDEKVVYITVGGTNSFSDVLTKAFSKHDIEVITILENWDNMSSKAVFQNPPKKIGVWGEQSVKFGSLIHGIDPKIIIPIGNPRIEWLLRNVNKSPSPRNIFFGGGSVNLELEMVYLASAVKIAKSTGSIVEYLPHPKNYKHIEKLIKDVSSENLKVLGNYTNEIETDPANLPKLDLYIDPFENCKVFTSPLSTMNLEASLLGIPSIALDITTKMNLPDNKISDRHDHIHNIRDTEVFYFIESVEQYEKLLESLMSNSLSPIRSIAKQQTLTYLIDSNSDYTENLLNLIN
jgi:hypothetical protein